MLLRQFRKIDTYSWIKLLILALCTGILVGLGAGEGLVEVALTTLLLTVLGSLSGLIFRERWSFKSTNFRYLIFSVFVLLWSVDFAVYELLVWAFLIELQWQFAEFFRSRKNTFWLLNNATLAALVPIFTGGNGFLFSFISLLLVLRTANIRPVHIVSWLFGFGFPLVLVFSFENIDWVAFNTNFNLTYSCNLNVWIPLGLLFVLTANQIFNSYRRANQTNKMRTVVAFYMVLLGSLGAWMGIGPLAFATVLVGLSYQGANALYYMKSRWYNEIFTILFLAYSILLIFGVTLPI
ncbi:MAG TPA: hypothetical protein DIT65_02565 [Cryomorphaceae bacterium]|nr:hypothetical protein [Cryomorphaceae bacterium]|tara:strand:- start:3447 stop:4328 length:882 start_codon:yes stop_codon:yes gene_type:complete